MSTVNAPLVPGLFTRPTRLLLPDIGQNRADFTRLCQSTPAVSHKCQQLLTTPLVQSPINHPSTLRQTASSAGPVESLITEKIILFSKTDISFQINYYNRGCFHQVLHKFTLKRPTGEWFYL